jgi:hypothetical protein
MYVEEGSEYDAEWGARWDYVIGEMIFAFECISDIDKELQESGYNAEGMRKTDERIANGLRLFGRYFRSLWT